MGKNIQKVAVLGAGTMGSRIAAHLANAGIQCLLLDIVAPGDGPRNRVAEMGLDGARKSKPAAFFEPGLGRLITTGNFEDDLSRLASVDWVIEAVVEDLEIKRALLRKVEAARRPGSIVTTNTSGLPVSKIAEGFSEDFRRHWFGTHFFNPPRYMRLLEIIPTPQTDRAALDTISHFCDVRLGKGIVFAKDTPNFIANRIGTFSALNVMRIMQDMDLTVEQVDALTGPAVGWPKSATFRTADLVGLDVLAHVVGNLKQNVHDERSDLQVPQFVKIMLERRWLGDKTGGGFYKKSGKGENAERLALDWRTLEYRPRQKGSFPALEMARNVDDSAQRLRMLLGLDGSGPRKGDKAAEFLWGSLGDLWTYSANRIGEISDSIADIDRAMRLGFNWEMGPFELWDAAGVGQTVEQLKKQGRPVAANVERLLASGKKSWYGDDREAPSGRDYFDLGTGNYRPEPVPAGVVLLPALKKSCHIVKKNAGASLVDVGDGVACIEFHSKMNALGGDIVQLITQTLGVPGRPDSGALGANFDAFVITNDAQNFSVGANVMLLLMSIQDDDWDEIDMAIRQFQGMTQAIKFSPKPVVVGAFGLTLGGGTEISLHAPARQPHAELYTGLVEVGVGLLPGGGGCKEMLLRALDSARSIRPDGRGESVELLEA
ncbi:MAG TPA: 3-hydroxyacyl-CoA dehydrogenase NAD-binding domain-containing protein, partial [Terriglobales bacterium]|nr:3-hydroxyacyl-CoA dehydrogenase NAD-binding domain-containing protein [Terriglobales bacterium]